MLIRYLLNNEFRPSVIAKLRFGTGICAALGCILPVSTPPNAIAYGSGCIPLMQMIKHGFVMTVVGIILTDAMVLWFVPLIFSGK